MCTQASLGIILSMESEDLSTAIKVNIMVSGTKVRNKDRACSFIPIKTFSQETGLMVRNTGKELTYLTPQE